MGSFSSILNKLSRSVFRGGGSVFGGGFVFLFRGVLGLAFIFDISDKSSIVIGGISHGLDSSIGQIDAVRT